MFFNALDLLPRRGALLAIQLLRLRASQPALGAVHNRGDHLQIAQQFGRWFGRSLLLPLRFPKQRRIVQNAFADRSRSSSPGGIQLASFAGIAVVLGQDDRQALTIL